MRQSDDAVLATAQWPFAGPVQTACAGSVAGAGGNLRAKQLKCLVGNGVSTRRHVPPGPAIAREAKIEGPLLLCVPETQNAGFWAAEGPGPPAAIITGDDAHGTRR